MFLFSLKGALRNLGRYGKSQKIVRLGSPISPGTLVLYELAGMLADTLYFQYAKHGRAVHGL